MFGNLVLCGGLVLCGSLVLSGNLALFGDLALCGNSALFGSDSAGPAASKAWLSPPACQEYPLSIGIYGDPQIHPPRPFHLREISLTPRKCALSKRGSHYTTATVNTEQTMKSRGDLIFVIFLHTDFSPHKFRTKTA